MPSEEGTHQHAQRAKKRRIVRACDMCRRKKRRCNGRPGEACLVCIEANAICTFDEPAKKRGPPRKHMVELHDRLRKMEDLLVKLHPHTDFSQELGFAPTASSSSPGNTSSLGADKTGSEDDANSAEEDEVVSSDEAPDEELSDRLRALRLDPLSRLPRSLTFDEIILRNRALSSGLVEVALPQPPKDPTNRRAMFWTRPIWETCKEAIAAPRYDFPPHDLLPTLIHRYFGLSYVTGPILHRPTFERSVAEGLHHRDESFAALVLIVCAIGARACDDPRVVIPGWPSQSAGWQWYNQVQVIRETQLLLPPTLYELQRYALATVFLLGSSWERSAWTILGIGLRVATDAGVHRKGNFQSKPTVDEEQWRRAFWVLVGMDTLLSATLSRPRAIRDEEIDVRLPLECDDEYWDHPDPEQAFKQPAGKPSYMSSVIRLLGLLRILSSLKLSILHASPRECDRHIADADRQLGKWLQDLPDHLRWDPTRKDDRLFAQTAHLHIQYCNVQIAIHRHLVLTHGDRVVNPAHVAACSTAAHMGIKIMAALQSRTSQYHFVPKMTAFMFGIVLVVNMWANKQSPMRLDIDAELNDINMCLRILKASEERLPVAGRQWDRLTGLLASLNVDQMREAQAHERSSRKRRALSDAADTSTSTTINPPQEHLFSADGHLASLSTAESGFASQINDMQQWAGPPPSKSLQITRHADRPVDRDTAATPDIWTQPENGQSAAQLFETSFLGAQVHQDGAFDVSGVQGDFGTHPRQTPATATVDLLPYEHYPVDDLDRISTDDILAMWNDCTLGIQLDDYAAPSGQPSTSQCPQPQYFSSDPYTTRVGHSI